MANKSAAKKKANASSLDFMDSLGSNKSNYEQVDSSDTIGSAITKFIEKVKQNINDADLIFSGGMQNLYFTETEDGVFQVFGKDYLVYQNFGVNGVKVSRNAPFSYTDKAPPVDVFIEYIKSTNSKKKNNKKYYGEESPYKDLTTDKTIKSAAFALSKSIYNNGIKPKNLYNDEVKQLIEEIKVIAPKTVAKNFLTEIKSKKK